MHDYTSLIVGLILFGVNGVTGLVVWGMKGEIRSMREEFRANLAEAELRFFQRVNGAYVKKEVCAERCHHGE